MFKWLFLGLTLCFLINSIKSCSRLKYKDKELLVLINNFTNEKSPCMYAGYLNNIYFTFVVSDQTHHISNENLIIWFNSPGQSLFYSFFYENGPFKIENKKFKRREFDWSFLSNILYINFPNKVENENETEINSKEIIQNFDAFLKSFLDLFKSILDINSLKNITISGEGSSALIIPEISKKILLNTEYPYKIKIFLVNPIIDMYIQLLSRKTILKGLGFMSKEMENIYDNIVKKCELNALHSKNYYHLNCPKLDSFIELISGGICMFDIRKSESFFKNLNEQLENLLNDDKFKSSFNLEDSYLFDSKIKLKTEKIFNSSLQTLLDLYIKKVDITIVSGQFGIYSTSNAIEEILEIIQEKSKSFIHNSSLWKIRSDNNEYLTIGYIEHLNENLTNIVIRNSGHFIGIDSEHYLLLSLKNHLKNEKYKSEDGLKEIELESCSSLNLCNKAKDIKNKCRLGNCECSENYIGLDCSLKLDLLNLQNHEFTISKNDIRSLNIDPRILSYEKSVHIEFIKQDPNNYLIGLLPKKHSNDPYNVSRFTQIYRFNGNMNKLEFFVSEEDTKNHFIIIKYIDKYDNIYKNASKINQDFKSIYESKMSVRVIPTSKLI